MPPNRFYTLARLINNENNMRSTKTKEQIFRDGFGLFTNGQIPDDILNNYLIDEDGEATFELQCWINNNVRGEVMDWITGIGIIEAVELLYESALENGNLSIKDEM
jgi:hypothetical protein